MVDPVLVLLPLDDRLLNVYTVYFSRRNDNRAYFYKSLHKSYPILHTASLNYYALKTFTGLH